MAKKVLRLTRHSEMSPEQSLALQASVTILLGEEGPHDVITVSQTVGNAAEVLALAEEHGADVLEVVLPIAILADLVNPRNNTKGIPVIRASMERRLDGDVANFIFSRYERIVKIEVVTEALA